MTKDDETGLKLPKNLVSEKLQKALEDGAKLPQDLVTEKLQKFLADTGQQLVRDILESVSSRGTLLYLRLEPLNDSPTRVNETLKKVEDKIKIICQGNNFSRLLILLRKVSHELIVKLLQIDQTRGALSLGNFSKTLYFDGILIGTNYALKFCTHSQNLTSVNDRYKFDPTTQELTDAVSLVVLCIIYQIETFYKNSIIRRSIASSISLYPLLDSYNRRLRIRWQPERKESSDNILVFPAVSTQLPLDAQLQVTFPDQEGNSYILILKNFCPVSCNGLKEIEHYAYLDTNDFTKLMGINFKTWCKVWLGLNSLILENTVLYWSNVWFKAADPNYVHACVERTDDYCETGLGSGIPESIWKSCHTILSRDQQDNCPTAEECRIVVEGLTYQGEFQGDVRFIEQPYVFYKVSPKFLFWDYLRHGGLLRCIARELSKSNNNELTDRKGKHLESAIKLTIQKRIRETSHFKLGPLIKREREDKWEVDVGFVYKGILFLVEAKNMHKKVKYYYRKIDVTSRLEDRKGDLLKQDENFNKYKMDIRNKWSEVADLKGGICIVCSEEAEFIHSSDQLFWLSWKLNIPRICMLTELVKFLENMNVRDIEKHPAYLPF